MSKNLILIQPTILRSNLTYSQACILLERAESAPCTEELIFSISLKKDQVGWTFEAMPRALAKAFLDNPGDYVIQDVADSDIT